MPGAGLQSARPTLDRPLRFAGVRGEWSACENAGISPRIAKLRPILEFDPRLNVGFELGGLARSLLQGQWLDLRKAPSRRSLIWISR